AATGGCALSLHDALPIWSPRPGRGRLGRKELARGPVALTGALARAIWMRAQRLDETAPFGEGPQAAAKAISQLGYLQIDTINVRSEEHTSELQSREKLVC